MPDSSINNPGPKKYFRMGFSLLGRIGKIRSALARSRILSIFLKPLAGRLFMDKLSGWQPIETCPSHPLGRSVLLCIFPVYRCFVGLKCHDGTFASSVGTDKGYAIKLGPTHWMPLPEPPEEV